MCMKAKVNVLAKPHPYIFFTLQLHSAWGNVSQVHWQLVGVAHSQATSWPGIEQGYSMIQQYALYSK